MHAATFGSGVNSAKDYKDVKQIDSRSTTHIQFTSRCQSKRSAPESCNRAYIHREMGCMSSKEVEVINHVDLELAEAAERERYHFKVTKRIRR